MPTLSIVIPVYNMEHYLPRCFSSLLAQTFSDWEAILVDDGSTDHSGAICDRFASIDSRFQVIHQANGGVCCARNTGIRHARGKWITFMDQDDYLSPCCFSVAVAHQTKYPNAIIGWPFTSLPDDLWVFSSLPSCRVFSAQELAVVYASGSFNNLWNKLFLRELICSQNLYLDETIRDGTEDLPFVAHYFHAFFSTIKDASYVHIHGALYFYETTNGGSVSLRPCPLKESHFETYDFLMQDFLTFYRVPPKTMGHFLRQYMTTIAYGFYCLPLSHRHRQARYFFQLPQYAQLVEQVYQTKTYWPLYLPFKWKSLSLIRVVFGSRQRFPWLYHKLDWFGYFLLNHSGNWMK